MKQGFFSDLHSFLAAIVDDPNEYLPVIVLVGGLLLIWSLLCLSAYFSRYRTLLKPERRSVLRFWLAFIPLFLSVLILACGKIPVSFEGAAKWQMDLKWLFTLPCLIGSNALYVWWRVKRNLRLQNVG